MEQHTLKNVSNCLNTNIYFYVETFFSTPVLIRQLRQLKTVVVLVSNMCCSIGVENGTHFEDTFPHFCQCSNFEYNEGQTKLTG